MEISDEMRSVVFLESICFRAGSESGLYGHTCAVV